MAFDSTAGNLSAEDGDLVADVFVRDVAAGTTTLVSRAGGPAGPGGTDASTSPSISADGRHVAFDSRADNLSSEDVDTVGNVFVRDLVAGTTVLVSRTTGTGGAVA